MQQRMKDFPMTPEAVTALLKRAAVAPFPAEMGQAWYLPVMALGVIFTTAVPFTLASGKGLSAQWGSSCPG